jgi:hypothetical protein
MNYDRAASEGVWMIIVCDGYPEAQVSQENFLSIQWVINGIVDKLPEEGFHLQAHRYLLG